MWQLHNLNQWQRNTHPIMTIDTGNNAGGDGDDKPVTSENSTSTDDPGKQDERSREFSRALAKRKAELEKQFEDKYQDYEELKKKAQAFDEQQESGKSDMDKLNERLAAIEAERDKLAAEKQHAAIVAGIAKETELPEQAISLLAGDDEESLRAAATELKTLMGERKPRRGAPPATHANSHEPNTERHGIDLLRDAYTN